MWGVRRLCSTERYWVNSKLPKSFDFTPPGLPSTSLARIEFVQLQRFFCLQLPGGRRDCVSEWPSVSYHFITQTRLQQYAMVDILSEGQLDVAVGRGYLPHEYEGFCVCREEGAERFEEALSIFERAWSGGSFTFEGKYFQ